tara:strand:+ start:414 stop:1124 length:711 start_codon:yes stop_codon:yes gene_type:complete
MYLSKTGIKTLLYCPFQYKCKLEKIPVSRPPPYIFAKGQMIHDFCAYFYDHYKVRGGKLIPTTFVDKNIKSQVANFLLVEEKRYHALLRADKITYFKPVLIEERFEKEINGTNIFTYIDRLEQTDNGYCLGEIKGRPRNSDRWELAFGQICINKEKYDVNSWRTIYYGNGTVHVELSDYKFMDKVLDDVHKAIDIVKNNDNMEDFAYNMDCFDITRCNLCQYSKYCGIEDMYVWKV